MRHGRRSWVWRVGSLVPALVLGACSHGAPAVPPANHATSAANAPSNVWLGVLAAEDDPNALDDRTNAVEALVDGALVVSPGGCFSGIPQRYASGYVLGVTASHRREVMRLLDLVDTPAGFVGSVVNTCID